MRFKWGYEILLYCDVHPSERKHAGRGLSLSISCWLESVMWAGSLKCKGRGLRDSSVIVQWMNRHSLLSIQKTMGGGRPAGGRQCSTRDWPFWATIGLKRSLDHRGDPAGRGNLIMWPAGGGAYRRGREKGERELWRSMRRERGENTACRTAETHLYLPESALAARWTHLTHTHTYTQQEWVSELETAGEQNVMN